jgi:transposase
LQPLVEALKKYVLGAEKLHGDDVPVPVLEPGRGKTKTKVDPIVKTVFGVQ